MLERRVIGSVVAVVLALLLALLVPVYHLMARAACPRWRPGQVGPARLALHGNLPVLELDGSPAERGAQAARLVGAQAADLIAVMRLSPMLNLKRETPAFQQVFAAMRREDRAELAAFAATAGIPERDLLEAHATVETMCSAVVRVDAEGVRLGRNMDFAPPGTLGATTQVLIEREPGRHAYANIGWPGMFGVISGMNDRGLTACILLNWWGVSGGPGEPLPLTVRHLLQTCGSVDEAAAAFAAAQPGSRHYVLLADAHSAALVWRDRDGVHREDPQDGWLVVDNNRRSPLGNRACRLVEEAAATGGKPDAAWFRSATTATYMFDNAQAMTFTCAARRLELARAIGAQPAALMPWVSLELGPVLDGAGVDGLQPLSLPPARRLRHYR